MNCGTLEATINLTVADFTGASPLPGGYSLIKQLLPPPGLNKAYNLIGTVMLQNAVPYAQDRTWEIDYGVSENGDLMFSDFDWNNVPPPVFLNKGRFSGVWVDAAINNLPLNLIMNPPGTLPAGGAPGNTWQVILTYAILSL